MKITYQDVPKVAFGSDIRRIFADVSTRETPVLKLNRWVTSELLGLDSAKLAMDLEIGKDTEEKLEKNPLLVETFGHPVIFETISWSRMKWHIDTGGPVLHLQGRVFGVNERVAKFTRVKEDFQPVDFCADMPRNELLVDGVVYRCTTKPGEALCFYGEGSNKEGQGDFLAHYFSGSGTWAVFDSQL